MLCEGWGIEMSSRYYENLIKTVIDNSLGKAWEEAVKEWEIIDCEEDEGCSSQCVCGKENIKYLYLIHNTLTDKQLCRGCGSTSGREILCGAGSGSQLRRAVCRFCRQKIYRYERYNKSVFAGYLQCTGKHCSA